MFEIVPPFIMNTYGKVKKTDHPTYFWGGACHEPDDRYAAQQ